MFSLENLTYRKKEYTSGNYNSDPNHTYQQFLGIETSSLKELNCFIVEYTMFILNIANVFEIHTYLPTYIRIITFNSYRSSKRERST